MPLQTAYQIYVGKYKLTLIKPRPYYLKMIKLNGNCNWWNQNCELPDGT